MKQLRCSMLFCIQTMAIITLIGIIGCGPSRHLTSQDIRWVDDDRYRVPQPPQKRDPNYTWDYFHRSFFYPVDRFLNPLRRLGSNDAANTNALGEVPDSSWYTNRHAHKRMTVSELVRGPNRGTGPDTSDVWTIVRSKTQGVTPGFDIRDQKGNVYVIKFDPIDHPEMATAAEAISTLFLYAAGYNTPENYIVHFDPEILVIGEGTRVTDHKGRKRQMTKVDLQEILARVSHRPDGTIRALASKFISGRPIGPFSYISRRKDDPNDIYHHRNRRELRGLKVVASFLNHVDIKGLNTHDFYVTENGTSYVKHYLLDFGATLGSASTHSHNAATGHEHSFDVPKLLKSLFTLGLLGKPWDKSKTMEHPAIGFFEADTFHPGKWKESYTNAAFLEMTDQDAYWGAKIVMSFTPDEIRALVKQGQYSNPEVEKYIADTLIKRRDKIGRYWFSKVNPLDRFAFKFKTVSENVKLSFTDLGIDGGLWQPARYYYELRHYKSNQEVDSGMLIKKTEIPISAEVLSSMNSFVSGKSVDDENRYFYYQMKTERDQKLSKDVRIYLYFGEEGIDKLKIVRLERES